MAVNRGTRKGKLVGFEYLRIEERPVGIVYVAQPGGRPGTEFTLRKLQGTEVVFENPDHDFPQRIIYRIDEEGRLIARIEGRIGGSLRFKEWTYERDE